VKRHAVQNCPGMSGSPGQGRRRLLLDAHRNHAPAQIPAQSRGRSAAELYPPAPSQRLRGKRANMRDLIRNRGGVDHRLAHCYDPNRASPGCGLADDPVGALAIPFLGFEREAKLLAHHTGKKPAHRVLNPNPAGPRGVSSMQARKLRKVTSLSTIPSLLPNSPLQHYR